MENTKRLIIDIDDVIFPLGTGWFKRILASELMQESLPHIKLMAGLKEEYLPIIGLRNTYYLNKFLEIPDDLYDHFQSLYQNDATFYDDMHLLRMGVDIRTLMKYLKRRGSFTFLSHAVGGLDTPTAKSKIRAIKKHFGDIAEYELLLVETQEEKANVVKDRLLDWNILFEDNNNNVANIISITADNLEGIAFEREIFAPWYGYNDGTDEDFPFEKLKAINGSFDHVGKQKNTPVFKPLDLSLLVGVAESLL